VKIQTKSTTEPEGLQLTKQSERLAPGVINTQRQLDRSTFWSLCEAVTWLGLGKALLSTDPLFEASVETSMHPDENLVALDRAWAELSDAAADDRVTFKGAKQPGGDIMNISANFFLLDPPPEELLIFGQMVAGIGRTHRHWYNVKVRRSEVEALRQMLGRGRKDRLGSGHPSSTRLPRRKTGPRSGLTKRIAIKILDQLVTGEKTREYFETQKQEALATEYGASSRSTIVAALETAFSMYDQANPTNSGK
jgi:hypothetical protein